MLNVAVIGCGYWGMNYVRLLHDFPQVRLLSACDANPARIRAVQERFPLLSVGDDFEAVLDNRWVDAVVIATPAGTHHRLVKRALTAGKHVLVEKPMTTDPDDAEDLVQTAQASDRTLMVGFTFLYNNGILKMKELIRDERFGEPYYLHFTRTNMGPVRSDVSALWDLASHDLAICDFLLESEPLWVQANAATVLEHELPDVGFITLGYPGNILANIHVSWVDPNKVREIAAIGSRQRIVFDDLNASERVRIYEKGIGSSRQEADSFGEFRLLVRDGDIISPHLPGGEPLRSQAEHFLDCIASGRAPRSDADMGAANVRALAAIERSLASNGLRVSPTEAGARPSLEASYASSDGAGRI